jgi:hypothetical protein
MAKRGMIVLWFVVVLCTGCAKYWYQEGKTFEQCKQDRMACLQELKKRSDFSGATADYEFKFMEACMKQKGYRLVSEKKLPLSAKRERPDMTLHYRMKGIAGDLLEQQ